MATNQQILREYLVSLGYQVDGRSEKDFDKSLIHASKGVMRLGTAVFGVMAATQAFVVAWARSMDSLYYSSRRAESSVGNLQALQYAFRNIGLSGDGALSTIEGMARAMRLNPGLQGLIESFGIPVTGRDKSDVMIDFVDALRKLPFYQAAAYANLFGIDPDTLLLLQEGLDKLRAAAAARKEMAAAAGVDADKAAAAAKEYANQLREIQELFGLLKDTLAIGLLPFARDFAETIKSALQVTRLLFNDWVGIIDRYSKSGGIMGFAKDVGSGAMSSIRDWLQQWIPAGKRKGSATPLSSPSVSAGPVGDLAAVEGDPESLFDYLERKYGLPAGLLDRMWAKESSRGKNMLSPAGAMGHFQFMPKTAEQYGVKDPNNLTQSASGAARYMSELLNKYGGNLQMALAAYNWGMGNLDKKGLARAPAETIDYAQSISGQPVLIQQTNDIKVMAPDPQSAGAAVAREQRRVGADLVRNFKGAIDAP